MGESWRGKDMELAFAGISCAIDLLEQLFLFYLFVWFFFLNLFCSCKKGFMIFAKVLKHYHKYINPCVIFSVRAFVVPDHCLNKRECLVNKVLVQKYRVFYYLFIYFFIPL